MLTRMACRPATWPRVRRSRSRRAWTGLRGLGWPNGRASTSATSA